MCAVKSRLWEISHWLLLRVVLEGAHGSWGGLPLLGKLWAVGLTVDLVCVRAGQQSVILRGYPCALLLYHQVWEELKRSCYPLFAVLPTRGLSVVTFHLEFLTVVQVCLRGVTLLSEVCGAVALPQAT